MTGWDWTLPIRSFLYGSKAADPTHSPPPLHVSIHLPFFGAFIYPSPSASPHPPEPYVIRGEVEARIPTECVPVRCHAIRLILRGWSRLPISAHRSHRMEKGVMEWEGDVFYQKMFPLMGETILRPGSQRFEFRLSCLEPLAQSDNNIDEVQILHDLFVEFIGQQSEPVNRLPSPYDGTVPEEQEQYTVPTLTYPDGDDANSEGVGFLPRTVTAGRPVIIKYNPNLQGGVNTFDDELESIIAGLGLVRASCKSDVFTVGGPMIGRIEISSPSSLASIFAFRLSIVQRQTLVSPRDGFKHHSEETVPFATIGIVPISGYPDSETPTVFKGRDIGGSDPETGWSAVIRGRFPHGSRCRPSTISEIPTPVTLSHSLVYETFYSIHSETYDGRAMAVPGPGQMRRMVKIKPIFLPACCFIPDIIDLPMYGHDLPGYGEKSGASKNVDRVDKPHVDTPCSKCHRRPSSMLCKTCPASFLPHVSHTIDCPACNGSSLAPSGVPNAKAVTCACVLWEQEANGSAVIAKEEMAELTPQVQADGIFAVKIDGEKPKE